MRSAEGTTHDVAQLLGVIRRKGVKLWVENGLLRYTTPKGALTESDVRSLRACKEQVIALLGRSESAQAAEPRLVPRRPGVRAPLTFSQLLHWHSFRLSERTSMRATASVMRLSGSLNLE